MSNVDAGDALPVGGKPAPHTVFQSSTLPVQDRFDAWRESVLPLFDSIPDTPLKVFHARVESVDLGHVFVGMSAFSPLRFHRESRHAAAGDTDHLLVQLYLAGGYEGHNGNRDVRVRPGDISLLDLSRELETRAQASNALSLIIPREQIYSFINPERIAYGSVLRGDSAMGRILGNHLLEVWRQLRMAPIEEAESIRHLLLSSIAGAFTGTPEQHGHLSSRATLDAMRAYIAQNLSEPLTPGELCRRFACSRAQLYRLFQPPGGVAAYIRDARLRRCWQELTESNGKTKRVLDVAMRWGFTSHSHFNRLFRTTFGMTPGEAAERGEVRWRARQVESRASQHALPELHGILRNL